MVRNRLLRHVSRYAAGGCAFTVMLTPLRFLKHFSCSKCNDNMSEESFFERSKKKWKKFQQRGRSPWASTLPATSQLSAPTQPSTSLDTLTISAPPSPAIEASKPFIIVSTPEIAAGQQDPPESLWSKAFERSSKETKKWIREHSLDLSEQAKPEDHIRDITRLIESNTLCTDKDGNSKIDINYQKIVFREYIADVAAFLTMAGDIAINFAPPQASAPWAIAKAMLKVSVSIYTHGASKLAGYNCRC